jgi:hypothetical protein
MLRRLGVTSPLDVPCGDFHSLATTFPRLRANLDVEDGDWRPLDLELPPFDRRIRQCCPSPHAGT